MNSRKQSLAVTLLLFNHFTGARLKPLEFEEVIEKWIGREGTNWIISKNEIDLLHYNYCINELFTNLEIPVKTKIRTIRYTTLNVFRNYLKLGGEAQDVYIVFFSNEFGISLLHKYYPKDGIKDTMKIIHGPKLDILHVPDIEQIHSSWSYKRGLLVIDLRDPDELLPTEKIV